MAHLRKEYTNNNKNIFRCSNCNRIVSNANNYGYYDSCICSQHGNRYFCNISSMSTNDVITSERNIIDQFNSEYTSSGKFKIVIHKLSENNKVGNIIQFLNDNYDKNKNIEDIIEESNRYRYRYLSKKKEHTYILEFNLFANLKKDKIKFYIDGILQKGWKRNVSDHFGINAMVLFRKAFSLKYADKISNIRLPSTNLKTALDTLLSYPYLEILINAGFYGDSNTNDYYSPYDPMPHYVNKQGKTPSEILKLDKARTKLFKDFCSKKIKTYGYNYYYSNNVSFLLLLQNNEISIDVLRKSLNLANDYFESCSQSNSVNVGFCNPIYIGHIIKFATENNYSPDRLLKYLTEDIKENQGIYNFNNAFDTLKDYVEISKTLEMPYEKYPKSLALNHDRLVYLSLLKSDEYATKKFENARVNNCKLDYSNSKFMAISPKDISDLKREGSDLGHCVGTYVDKYSNGKSKIFFMRKINDPDTAYVTIELNEDNVLIQVKGAFNRAATEEEMKFVNEFLENIIESKKEEGVA